MTEPRYITVKVGDKDVSVRVISEHPDDNTRQELRSFAEDLWDWCDTQRGEAMKISDPEKAKTLLKTLAVIKSQRGQARRDLFDLILDKITVDEREELLRSMTLNNVHDILAASRGTTPEQSESLRRLQQALALGVTPSTP